MQNPKPEPTSPRRPPKLTRMAVWLSAPRNLREDILVNFEEDFENVHDKFGPKMANMWAISQAVRSVFPHGFIAWVRMFTELIVHYIKLG